MRKLIVFNNVSLDGYFTDADGSMSWAHPAKPDPEYSAFVAGNAGGGGELVFGRITYEMMAAFWPTPAAMQSMPTVAQGMNAHPKVVFSRTLEQAPWNNTRLLKGDLVAEMRKLKEAPGKELVVLGSGSLVSRLAGENIIDEYQLMVIPIALGRGRTLFDGLQKKLPLARTQTRSFGNGNVLLCYEAIR